jgi:hypothetical protein
MRFLSEDYWYEVALGRPETHAQHVVIVTIGPDMPAKLVQGTSSQPLTNISPVCERRLYEATLLEALSAAHPKVIVADMWLDPKGCTDAIAKGVLLTELANVNVPLVFGLPTYDPAALIKAFPAEFSQARNRLPPLKSTELVLMPILHPPRSSTNSVSEGTVELNSDVRKIPLSWPVYEDIESIGKPNQPRRLDSLAIATIRAFDPNNKSLSIVGALLPNGSPTASIELHPYTSLLPEEQLPIYTALDVLCSHPIASFPKENCHGTPSVGDLSNKIVVTGLAGLGGDIHQSPIGDVPGVVLQANYMESLMDGRVFKPVPVTIQIVVGIIWLAIIFWIPLQFLSQPRLALVLSLLAGCVTALLMFWTISYFKFYPEGLIPVVLVAFLLNVSRQIERWISRREETP